jgi:hypothetical protein
VFGEIAASETGLLIRKRCPSAVTEAVSRSQHAVEVHTRVRHVRCAADRAQLFICSLPTRNSFSHTDTTQTHARFAVHCDEVAKMNGPSYGILRDDLLLETPLFMPVVRRIRHPRLRCGRNQPAAAPAKKLKPSARSGFRLI